MASRGPALLRAAFRDPDHDPGRIAWSSPWAPWPSSLSHDALWKAFAASGLAGIGVGFTFAAMPGFIIRAVPAGRDGRRDRFLPGAGRVGLSVARLAAAVLTGFTHAGHAYPTAAGFRTALVAASGLCVLTAVVSYVLPGPASPTGPGPTAMGQLLEEEGELGATGLMLSGEELEYDPGPGS